MPRKRARSPVTPAQDKSRSDFEDDDFLMDETQSLSGRSSQEPQHRNAANARERARMRVLSKAFCRLKTTLPWVPADTKLSKLDTLRLAASYIAHLRALLHDEPRTAAQMFPHPLNLAWPFAFQHGGTSGQCSQSPRSAWSPAQSDSPPPMSSENASRENVNVTRDNVTAIRENYNLNQNRDVINNAYTNELAGNETNCESNVQYCNNYSYRDNYYELRNAYSDSLLNNIQ